MTKLMEWLTAFVVVVGIWLALFYEKVSPEWCASNRQLILWSPIIGIGIFGVYCVLTIAYRVATFNDCEDAAEELKQQIDQAKEDLNKKGLKI